MFVLELYKNGLLIVRYKWRNILEVLFFSVELFVIDKFRMKGKYIVSVFLGDLLDFSG